MQSVWTPRVSTANSRRTRTNKPPLRIENLENREVPATLDLSGGVLSYVAGSGINNTISVTVSGSNFVIGDTGETITTSISGSSGSGSNSVSIPTGGVTAINLDLGDGANAVNSSGGINITNVPLTISNVAGSLTTSGAIATAGGSIAISAGNGVTISANINAGAGQIAINANQDGSGAEGLTQTAGTITSTDASANAVQLIVNTVSGGTGDAIIDSATVGNGSGGKLSINSHGGDIVFAGGSALTAGQVGLTNGGSAPSRVLAARGFDFTATGAGGVGTTARPIQVSSLGTDALNGNILNVHGGDGGVYVTKWGGVDGTLAGASATGSGGIRIVAANVGGNNLFVTGNVAAQSGSIYLAADDNFAINVGSAIGGSGFSGTVWIQANRDQGTAGQPLTMAPTAAILTSNTTDVAAGPRTPTTQAVYLDISGDAGTPSPITLGSISTGNGGRIVVNAIPNGIANEAGSIAMADASNVLDAGANGTIVLTAGITATTNSPAANVIGTGTIPIQVAGGNVNVNANLGSVNIVGASATNYAASMTATASQSSSEPGSLSLATTSGALTIGSAIGNVNGGTLTVSGAGGVVLNGDLGSSSTGAIAIDGALSGSSNIAAGTGSVTISQSADSTFAGAITGSQSLTKLGIGNLTLSANQPYSGTTSVSAGILTLAGSLQGTSAVSIASGATLASTTGSTTAPVSVNGTLSPGAIGVHAMGAGNLSFGSGGRLAVNLNAPGTPGTDFDQVNVIGSVDVSNASLRVIVGATPSLTIGDSFTFMANDDTDAITGQFANGAVITAFDNPRYKFTISYTGGDGNDITLTLSNVLPPRFVDLVAGNTLTYVTGASIDSSLNISVSGNQYVIQDLSGTIDLSEAAESAGWTGEGTNTVTGPVASITKLDFDLSDGNDAITSLNGGTTEVIVNAAATLTTTGTATTGGPLTFTNASILNLGGTVVPVGNLNSSAIGTLNLLGTVGSNSTVNLGADTILADAASDLATTTANLVATIGIGTSSNPLKTHTDTLTLAAGNGGIFLAEADGGTVSATATGTGGIEIFNATGQLNATATSQVGDVLITNTAGQLNVSGNTESGDFSAVNQVGALNVSGAIVSASGNIALTSNDDVVVAADVAAGSGSISIAANADGVGSESFTQSGGNISTANTTTSAASITVNTSGGGSGNVSIDNTTVGGSGGGQLTINSFAGSILYAGNGDLDNFRRGVQGNGGSAPGRVLRAGNYVFTTTGDGSIGTDLRPIQSDNLSPTNTGNFSAGSGGIYWTDWGTQADFALNGAVATGAGGIRVVTANADGHDLNVVGPVTTESGSIFLAADDNYNLTAAVGGANFSGTVYMAGNRDTGNTMNVRMNAGASITTSNTSANAVYLEGWNNSGTRAGGITLNTITVGDGGTIRANTNPVSASQGDIKNFDNSVLLNAGTTGTVILTTAPQASVATTIGTAASPIRVTAGTVVATSNTTTSTTGTTSGIFITSTDAATFTAQIGGPNTNAGDISLTTLDGVLTIGGVTGAAGSGSISLSGADGIIVNAPLSNLTTGNLTLNAGSNPATLNSTLTVNSGAAFNVTASDGLLVTSTGRLEGSGAAANAPVIRVQSGGVLAPGGSGVGVLSVGDLVLASGARTTIDLNSASSADAVKVNGPIDLAGSRLILNVNGNLTAGDAFTIVDNDGADAITGTFIGDTAIISTNDPRYSFSLNYSGGDGNDVIATVASVASTNLVHLDLDGLLTFVSPTDQVNDVTLTRVGGNYVITDPSGEIALTADAQSAGWSGGGTTTVTGPISAVTGISLALNNGNDKVNGIDAGTVPLAVRTTGALNVAGLVSTSNSLTISGVTDVGGTGTLAAETLTLTASNGLGSNSQRLNTNATVITASAGGGGIFLSEANGADLSAVATSTGVIDVVNLTGTLNVASTLTTGGGSILLASGDAITLDANVNPGAGSIAISANTDGVGSQGFDQKGALLLTTSTASNAVSITVGGTGNAIIGQGTIGSNSGGGIAVNSGGSILWSNDPSYAAFTTSQTGEAGGGSNTQVLRALEYSFVTGAAGSVGTAARPLQIDNFGANDDVSSVPNLTASAGSGGVYALAWDSNSTDLTVGNVSAQGAGNILLAAANAASHNLWIHGTVTSGSGSVSLLADDEFAMTANGFIGGAGFSGSVSLLANRDEGNGQSVNMLEGSGIATSNASDQAVTIVAHAESGSTGSSDLTPQGGVVLTNITVGDGGTITVNAAGGTAAARQGSIVQRSGSLNAGPNGSVILLARANDSTGALNTGNIGANGDLVTLVSAPINVTAGTVTAITNGTALNNTGVIELINSIGGAFTASTTGNPTAYVKLTTQSGVLNIAGDSGTGGGPITLIGADGVAVYATLGNSTTAAIDVTGVLTGSGNIILGTAGLNLTQDASSKFSGTISGTQPIVKNGTGTLTLAGTSNFSGGTSLLAGGLLAANPVGFAFGTGPVVADDGTTLGGSGVETVNAVVSGILSPGDSFAGTGTLGLGDLSFGAAGTRTVQIQVNGFTGGSEYDQLNIAGTVDLTGSTLDMAMAAGFQPLLNDTFAILLNDGSEPITGEFVGLAEGSTFVLGNRTFELSYTGGDGNDLTARVTFIDAGPPVNTVPIAQTINEDTSLVFSTATTNAISVADPEFGGPLAITLTTTNGLLSLSGVNGLVFSQGDGVTDATMSFVGSVADINTALNGLTFVANANDNGPATVTILSSDQAGTGEPEQIDSDSVTINILSVNDQPSFTKGADQSHLEDAGTQSVMGWASNISVGPTQESAQLPTFLVSSDNAALFSVQPTINADGDLSYTLANNANGVANVTVSLQDNGGTGNGGVDTSVAQSFVITVTPVNNIPSFTKGTDQNLSEDAGPQTVSNWATAVSAGPENESGQSLSFELSTTNDSLFSTLPAIDASGNLTFTPAADTFGTAIVTVILRDNGGTVNGGQDASPPQTFTIDVLSVNDAPSFTKGADQILPEDSGGQLVPNWATNILAGPANESSQSLAFTVTTNNDVLFSVLPSIDEDGNLTYTPVPNASGTAIVSVTLTDGGGTANGGVNTSPTQTFQITVDSVNDGPTIDPNDIPVLPYTPVRGKILPPGALISVLTEDIADQDVNGLRGIAITGIDNANGVWQYNLTGNDGDWENVPAVSLTGALHLADDGNTRIRFLPNTRFTGFASFTFKAWDQSNSLVEEALGDTTNLADNAYSVDEDRAWVAVGKTKPAIDLDGRTVLKPTKSDVKTSKTTLVKDALGIAGLETANVANLGMAITDASAADGTWQYQLARTKAWINVDTVSTTQALLLGPLDKLRFVPNPNVDGDTILTFLTWDQSTGTTGAKVDTTGSSAFGERPGQAVLDLVPVLDLSAGAVLNSVLGGGTSNEAAFSTLMNANHIVGDNLGVAITAAKGSGTWEYRLPGGTWKPVGKVSRGKALFLDASAEVRFTASLIALPGTAVLSFKAWDKSKFAEGSLGAASGSIVSKQTELLTVSIGNQPPQLVVTGTVTLPSVSSSSPKPSGGVTVKTLLGSSFVDFDLKAVKGIAITAADNANGKWQYSLGGNVWLDVGAVSKDTAVLLRDSAKIRFVPTSGFTGAATFSYVAWDRTTGQNGDRVDTDSGINAFSVATETATITVTP